MARIRMRVAVAMAAVSLGGCLLGSRAADRTLEIHQVQSTGTCEGQFQIDTSQLAPDAVRKRVDSGTQGSPVTSLTIDSRYPIRVLLVPAAPP